MLRIGQSAGNASNLVMLEYEAPSTTGALRNKQGNGYGLEESDKLL